MKTQIRFSLVSFLICTILTACGPSQAEVEATAAQAAENDSATLTAQAPTATATFTPSPTATATLLPSPTATNTPVPTPNLIHTDTPTSMPFVIDDEVKKEIESQGFDMQTGSLLRPKADIKPLKLDDINYAIYDQNDWGELSEYILHYEVKADVSASIAGCGVSFHDWDGFIAVDNQGTSMWVVGNFYGGYEQYITQPAVTSAFSFEEDIFTPFTLVVRGQSVEIYSGAKQIGQATVDLTSGRVGWMAYNLTGDGNITCTFQNIWVWSVK